MILGPLLAFMLVALIGAMGADEAEAVPAETGGGTTGSAVGKIAAIAIAVVVVLGIGAILVYWMVIDDEGDAVSITLYGFSVKGEVFDGKIIPAFKEYYKNKTGKDVTFETHYAGSGKVTNEVIAGAPADVMILSTEWDALQLKWAGLVTTEWTSVPHNGTISTSPWIILVRPGNPKNIQDFEDLGKPGVSLVHPDPMTSGGACWSLFSVYGSQLQKSTRDDGAPNVTMADSLMDDVIDNVDGGWPASAREALTNFVETGIGDALITYENDALLAIAEGKAVEMVYPESTISSEHKVVIVDANVDAAERPVLEEFVDFIYSGQVQRYMCEEHFRSLDPALNAEYSDVFPPLGPLCFTVDYLGGWETAHEDLIEGKYVDFREN